MVESSRVKITVLKKSVPQEVFSSGMPAATDIDEACSSFSVGQEFIVEKDGKMPEGFCTWAWDDIYKVVTLLQYGGNCTWINETGTGITCCTDGFRPVIFKVTRLEETS